MKKKEAIDVANGFCGIGSLMLRMNKQDWENAIGQCGPALWAKMEELRKQEREESQEIMEFPPSYESHLG